VVSMIKAEGGENPLGMDVDGAKERKAKSITQPQYDDAQNAANPTTNIEDQQATIQAADMDDDDDEKKAMTKNHIPGHNSDDDEKKAMKMKFKAEDDEDDNGSDEKPVDKADDDDETDDDGMKAMRKELDALRKTVAAYEANMEKSIEEQSESRLRKMGFREENGLQRPSLLNQEQALGTDGTTPIVKANASSGDVVEDLSGLSYKQLRNLQHKIDSGDTTGVPRELLGNQ